MASPAFTGRGDMASPASYAAVVTPHDSNNLSVPSRSLYVGTAGNVSVQMVDLGTAIVFVGVPAGAILPIRVLRVNSTGTTASNIVSLY